LALPIDCLLFYILMHSSRWAAGLCVAIGLVSAAAGCSGLDSQRALRACNSGSLSKCYSVANSDQDGIVNKDYLARMRREEREAALREKTRQSLANSAPHSQLDGTGLIAKASLAIISSCAGWQMGIIQRGAIMDSAKGIFQKQGFDPESVDWSRAIEVAKQLDKEKNLGCIK
jgi:hypothetical protein